jgi:aspartate aminotransferase
MYLLAEGQIALVSGEGFGSPSCIRISYAASEEMLTEAMRRMKEALLKLSV